MLGGGTWLAYKSFQAEPNDNEYNQIMASIVASPDLNELISEQMTYFDTAGGLKKTVLTCLSKAFSVSARKAMAQSSLDSELPVQNNSGVSES